MSQPLRTVLLALVAGLLFIAIDTVLAQTERRETAAEAARLSSKGKQLMQQGRYAEAIQSFRAAIANQRGNPQYPLELGRALRSAGHLREAEATLEDLLRMDAMDGAANLAMARVFVKQGEFEPAAFYYHRAIYGQWKADEVPASRLRVRFELADLLAQHNMKSDLLAELLPLQSQAPADLATQERLAGLYLTAGAPARAVAIYREQSRIHPRDESIRKGLYLADQVLRLDPSRPDLNEKERYERSLHLLQLATDRAEQCRPAANPAGGLPDKSPEANLNLARKAWAIVQTSCGASVSEADRALELVLSEIPQ